MICCRRSSRGRRSALPRRRARASWSQHDLKVHGAGVVRVGADFERDGGPGGQVELPGLRVPDSEGVERTGHGHFGAVSIGMAAAVKPSRALCPARRRWPPSMPA